MTARRLLASLLIVVITFPQSIAAADGAPEATSTAVCLHRWTDTIVPGLTTAPRKVRFTSNGETGTIDCAGQVRGLRVTGPGTFGEAGVFDGTCLAGSGSAVFSFTLPTTGGTQSFSIPVTFTHTGLTGVTSGA